MTYIYLTFLIVLSMFVFQCFYTKKIVNGLSLIFLSILLFETGIPALAHFFNKILHVSQPPLITQYAGLIFIISYSLFASGLVCGYCFLQKFSLFEPIRTQYSSNKAILLNSLLLFIAVIFIAIIGIKTHMFPYTRSFYAYSRVGYGWYFFISEFFVTLSLIISLVCIQRKFLQISFVILAIFLSLAFGSKGVTLTASMIVFYWIYFILHGKIKISTLLVYGIIGVLTLLFAFWLFKPAHAKLLLCTPRSSHKNNYLFKRPKKTHFFKYMNNSFNYSKDKYIMKIKPPSKPFYGMLILQNNLYQQEVLSFGRSGVWRTKKQPNLVHFFKYMIIYFDYSKNYIMGIKPPSKPFFGMLTLQNNLYQQEVLSFGRFGVRRTKKQPNLVHFFKYMIIYFDYSKNYIMEIEHLHKTFYGMLTLQNNIYGVVPRVIWPNKPYVFGSLKLSHHFYQFNKLHQQGVPSFGRFGIWWADFKYFALVLIFISSLILGWLIGSVEKSLLQEKNNLFYFSLFIILAVGCLLNPGISAISIILINIIAVFIIHKLLSVKN